MSHKVTKIDNYWLSKPMPTTNSFEELEKMFNNINDKAKAEKTIKSLPFLLLELICNCSLNY